MPRKTRGKPPFVPTDDERKLVEQMTAVGIPQESICRIVRDGIDDKTLRKHFRSELDTAAVKANAKVGGSLFNKAVAGDTTAIIWWTKTRMGWSESSNLDLTSSDGSMTPQGMPGYYGTQEQRDALQEEHKQRLIDAGVKVPDSSG